VGVGATNYPLSPAFASGTTAYSVNLPAGATALTVAASKNNANASTPVVVGATGLVTGANNVSVTVTAQDGTSTVYSIIANVPSSLSNVSTLGSLSVGAATLSPTFASGTTAYTLSGVAAGTTSLAVTASATDANATVAITGNSGLVVGANTITVVCTAQDGVTKTTYTLSVTIAAGGGGGGGGKSFSPTAKLTVSATYGGTDHAAFWIWISDSTGAYVETLSLYGQGGTPTKPPSGGLPAVWTTAKGSTAAATNNGVDAVTAATWATGGSYVATHTQPWTFKNSAGTVLTQGTYTFHIEVHEMNGAGGSYSLPVTLGSSAVTQTFTSNAVLSAGSVNYTP
jgi:hypothetical protein